MVKDQDHPVFLINPEGLMFSEGVSLSWPF